MHSFNMFIEHLLWARFTLDTWETLVKKIDIKLRDYRTYSTNKYKITTVMSAIEGRVW